MTNYPFSTSGLNHKLSLTAVFNNHERINQKKQQQAKIEPRSPMLQEQDILDKDLKDDHDDKNNKQSPFGSSLLNNLNNQGSSTFISPFLKP